MSHSRCPSCATGALALLALAAPASAQAWTRDWPQPGDPVRVSSNAPPLDRARMTFQRQVNDTLVFVRSVNETSIALSDITLLQMPGIPRTGHRRAAAVGTGALIGAGAGAVIGYLSPTCDDNCGYFGKGFDRGLNTAVGILGGAVVGGVAGYLVSWRVNETWRTVHPRR